MKRQITKEKRIYVQFLIKYRNLFKTKLLSVFQHFHWLAGHKLSAVRKRAENIATLLKNGRQKPFWTGIKSTWKSC